MPLVVVLGSFAVVSFGPVGCGSEPMPDARSPRPAAGTAELPPGALAREDVVAVVDGGLGQFLQRIRVEPSLEGGRFVGFRVVELVPASYFRGADLRPGDVVTHVNGKSIEEPTQAFEVFESLRRAPALRVRLLREGRAAELTFPIVGAPVAVARSREEPPVDP